MFFGDELNNLFLEPSEKNGVRPKLNLRKKSFSVDIEMLNDGASNRNHDNNTYFGFENT